ncbi:MAG: sensor histidine kinase, partial [Gemmatirosa sp.]
LLERGAERAPFADEERALAAELARRAALAIENARLFRAAHDAVAARDQVLAVVAHDLRSPLTAARFDVEMLRAEPELPVGARDARMLLRVERAMARMDGLIEDLLDVARMNHDALALERRPQAMDALLTEAAASLRPLVESRGLRFVVHGPHALPTLDVDARRVLQAISNLVGNAAKFAAHEGTVALTWELAADALRIAVRDDGPGIPPEELQHIFGAFWQARHADRRGLGLGLSIALGIAEAHGGRIWVESRVGEGSTFVLALPTGGPRA